MAGSERMIRIYIGFDDTDTVGADRGTGKLARGFADALPDGCRLCGVVRQQLLVDPAVPYTSHNSAACAVVDAPDPTFLDSLIRRAAAHVAEHALAGSDPGVCVAEADAPDLERLSAFGFDCTRKVVSRQDARNAAGSVHLSGHGGTRDGIIGAAAAVGLTASGWSGRFIEYGDLRGFGSEVTVSQMADLGIGVLSTDRDAEIPPPDGRIRTHGWLRPRLIGHIPVLLVQKNGDGSWEHVGKKREKVHPADRFTAPFPHPPGSGR